MPATLVGFTANKLILNSSNFRREVVGLERITDVYTARTQDADFFQEIIANGESHRTITGYLTPVPSERFSDMLVENVVSTNMKGDITGFNVTYVGLCRDLRPKPIITLQPLENYAFLPFTINLEFIEGIGTIGSATEIAFLKKYKTLAPFPDKINGYTTIKSPVPSFAGNVSKFAKQYNFAESPFFSIPVGLYQQFERVLQTVSGIGSFRLPPGPSGLNFPFIGNNTLEEPSVAYGGIAIRGISYTRYGNFAHAIITGSEIASYRYVDLGNVVQSGQI